MALFLSTFVNKVDRKGRVSVPAPFRMALGAEADRGLILFRAYGHDCLEGFAFSFMEELSERLDHYDLFSSAQDDLATAVFGESVQLSVDGDGRMIIPQPLLAYAGIEDQAAFVGLGKKFQIWTPSSFEARRAAARENAKAQGLTLPKRPGPAGSKDGGS